ncbi:MAG TPA: hypothetical protein VF554_04980, partial [Thermoanaerobaculia bacterium]
LAGLIRKDTTKTKSTIPFLGDLPLIGALFTNNNTLDRRTDLYLTLTPHIIRSPQITDEDLIPIWVGTENNVSFSGLNTRLESPNATGSPFDGQPADGARPPVRPVVAPGVPSPGLVVPRGGMPNDPFRQTPTPPPATPKSNATATVETQALVQSATAAAVVESGATPASTAPAALTAVAAAAPAPAAIAGPVLRLEAMPSEVAPGAVSIVNLTGDSGLDALGALELTIEWDPFVAEVTAIAPGPWRSGFGGDTVRFDADRVQGRAQLHFKRTGGAGLPDGVLATLAVRALAPGTTLVRATAGTASTAGGATPTPRVEAASLAVKQAP